MLLNGCVLRGEVAKYASAVSARQLRVLYVPAAAEAGTGDECIALEVALEALDGEFAALLQVPSDEPAALDALRAAQRSDSAVALERVLCEDTRLRNASPAPQLLYELTWMPQSSCSVGSDSACG